MFGGQDVGELYDMEHDPDESRNLYHDSAHRDIVHRCRRLLLEWLIRSTRVVTCFPPLKKDAEGRPARGPARDGKEANGSDPAARARAGQVDYL